MDLYKYNCETCCFHTSFKNRYDSHVLTKRHRQKNDEATKNNYHYICQKCNKKFKSNSGLWSHKSKCNYIKIEVFDDSMRETINELKNMVSELKSNPTPSVTNNQNNNFNVNLILNENFTQAKNFVDMIQNICVEGHYPDKISSENYVSRVFHLIKSEIDKMPIDERPIHCIKDEDERQKILHIRHDNKWETETELEWTSQIHNYYLDDGDEPTPEEEKIIFNGLRQLEENIIAEIAKLNNTNTQREYSCEAVHPPNKVRIIKCLLDYVNIEKPELLKIIERAYSKKPVLQT